MDNSKWTIVFENYFRDEGIQQYDTLEECIQSIHSLQGYISKDPSNDMEVMIFPPKSGIDTYDALKISDLKEEQFKIVDNIEEKED